MPTGVSVHEDMLSKTCPAILWRAQNMEQTRISARLLWKPAAISWGLQRVLENLPDVFKHWWYLDDGLALGHLPDIARYVQHLQGDLGAMGLSVNLKKCAIWGPGTEKLGDLMDSESLHQIYVTTYVPGSGIKVLGIPVVHPIKATTCKSNERLLSTTGTFVPKNMGNSSRQGD